MSVPNSCPRSGITVTEFLPHFSHTYTIFPDVSQLGLLLLVSIYECPDMGNASSLFSPQSRHSYCATPSLSQVASLSKVRFSRCAVLGMAVSSVVAEQYRQCRDFLPSRLHVASKSTVQSEEYS